MKKRKDGSRDSPCGRFRKFSRRAQRLLRFLFDLGYGVMRLFGSVAVVVNLVW